MNRNRVYMPVTGFGIVLLTPLLVWLSWKTPGKDIECWVAAFAIKMILLIVYGIVASHLSEDAEDPVAWLTAAALVPGWLAMFVLLMFGPAMSRVWPLFEVVLFFYGLFMLLFATFKAEADAAGSSSEAPPAEKPKPQKKPERKSDAERERDEQLAELNGMKDLDPVVVEAQRQEIEANYQRKLAQRSEA